MRRKGTDRRILQQAITMEERRVAFRRDPEIFRREKDRRIEDVGHDPNRRVAQRRAEDIEKLQQDNAEVINLPLMP